jgi:hypothetical protein
MESRSLSFFAELFDSQIDPLHGIDSSSSHSSSVTSSIINYSKNKRTRNATRETKVQIRARCLAENTQALIVLKYTTPHTTQLKLFFNLSVTAQASDTS